MKYLRSRRINLSAWNLILVGAAAAATWQFTVVVAAFSPSSRWQHHASPNTAAFALYARSHKSRRAKPVVASKGRSWQQHSPRSIQNDKADDFVDDDDDDFFNYWDDDDDDDSDEYATMDDQFPKTTPPPAQPTSHFFSQKSLQDPSFVLQDPTVFESLCQGVGITRPSKIQSIAWPVLLQGKNAILADQTGSGKTLAYLIPLLQRVVLEKQQQQQQQQQQRRNGAPRVIILAPTAELADQTRAVCDQLCRNVVPRVSNLVVTATGKYATAVRDQIRLIERQPVDVLISTPGRLATILRTRQAQLDLQQLQAVVLDEVDVLMQSNDNNEDPNMFDNHNDETSSFAPQLQTLGAAIPDVEQVQFVFCTATLPDSIVTAVQQEFPSVVKLQGPGLHRVAPTIHERLVDVSVPNSNNHNHNYASKQNREQRAKLCFELKAKQLLLALRKVRCRRTLVFCNTVETCRKVENLLHRRDRQGQLYQVGSYHNAMTAAARNANLAAFCNNNHNHNSKNNNNLDAVLVCTDRASRGVDFAAAPVDHVVLFDFPKDPAEYVRRVGRTARAGRTGYSTVLAYGWQLPIARSVMGTNNKNTPNNSNNKQKKKNQFWVDESSTTTRAVDKQDDDAVAAAASEEYRGGVKGRRRRQSKKRQGKDNSIRGNIQGGRLWGD